ncbi:MAG: DNA polymerase/3'-5' exonuclease PolX [Planctomycetes bacterium]|nr:DNA polymerase/3'-5' exonuclease PolX [Planctomycetota bacterium]
MTNAEISAVLSLLADMLEIQGENPFKVRAYQNAARTIEGLEVPLGTLLEQGTLGELKGIGEGLKEKLTELHKTGRMTYFEQVRAKMPPGIPELLRVPSLGPKKVKALWQELGVTSLADLEEACRSDRVAGLKGFGARTQEKILEGLRRLSQIKGQFLVSEALPLARQIVEYLEAGSPARRAAICGSLRRGKSIVRDIDLLAASSKPRDVIEHFANAPQVLDILGKGPTKCSVRLHKGLQVDLRVVAEDEFAPALQYFTGSKEHNVLLRTRAVKMGTTLNEYGLFKGKKKLDCATEEDIYRHLKLSYIYPELREGRNEIDLAERGKLTQPIDTQDIKGVLHVHSTWSDGTADIEAMAEKARKMGYRWIGLSDHSKAAYYANGMDEARLKKQMKEVAALNRKWSDFRILHGLECDILPNGDLDLIPELLGKLDFVIGSIHSRFNMSESEMTDRICKAIRNEHLDVLGHPTGRLLLDREGYKVNLERVLQEAKTSGKVVELNANPHRLDLDDAHARRARELGVKISIDPDAHSTAGMEDVQYGVMTARRAGLTSHDVLNSLSAEKVVASFERS